MSSSLAGSPQRWRKRVILVLAGAALLLVLRLVWGEIAAQRVAAALADAGANGEPLTPAALMPIIPGAADDPDNAVPLLKQAMSAVSMTAESPSMSNLSYPDYPPYPPAWHKLADTAMLANQQSLQLARAARGRSRAVWTFAPMTPAFNTVSPVSLNGARNLANLLADGAIHAHVHGDDVEAIDRVLDTRRLGAAIGQQPDLTSYLVGMGIDILASDRIGIMAPGLRLPASRPNVDAQHETDPLRQRVRQLIADLLNDDASVDPRRRAIVAKRVMQIDTVRWLERRGSLDTNWGTWLLHPMYELDLARMLTYDRALLRAATQPTFPVARAVLANSVTSVPFASKSAGNSGDPPRFSRSLSQMSSALQQMVKIDSRLRTMRHMAAVSLAAQLYRADHGGAWPASLDALVPRYLPAVPLDPLAPNNRPLDYLLLKHALPDGRDRPIVHSLGPNGADDIAGRSPLPVPIEPTYSWFQMPGKADDQFCDLERWSPPAASSTAPAVPGAK